MTALAFNYVDKKTKHKFHLPLTIFKKPSCEEEYHVLEMMLDRLIDEVRDDESHPLVLAMQIIAENLEQYDDEHYALIGEKITDIEMVKYLMKEYHLQQKDLAPIFGGQANVSKFLSGKRGLSKGQIIELGKKFNMSANFFLK